MQSSAGHAWRSLNRVIVGVSILWLSLNYDSLHTCYHSVFFTFDNGFDMSSTGILHREARVGIKFVRGDIATPKGLEFSQSFSAPSISNALNALRWRLNVEPQWETIRVGSSAVERHRVRWFPINAVDSARFCPNSENSSKFCRARLSGIPSVRAQWCQVHYFQIHSIWLHRTIFYSL